MEDERAMKKAKVHAEAQSDSEDSSNEEEVASVIAQFKNEQVFDKCVSASKSCYWNIFFILYREILWDHNWKFH